MQLSQRPIPVVQNKAAALITINVIRRKAAIAFLLKPSLGITPQLKIFN
jgi:hypothetical protein